MVDLNKSISHIVRYISKCKESVVKLIYKTSLALCILIFPSKLSSVFANLTILSLIYEIRGIELQEKILHNKKISHLLDMYVNETVFVFPKATMWLFWTEDKLSRKINLDGVKTTIRESIQDQVMFDRYKRRIIDYLIRDLPAIVKYKLNLNDRTIAIMFRNNVVQALGCL